MTGKGEVLNWEGVRNESFPIKTAADALSGGRFRSVGIPDTGE